MPGIASRIDSLVGKVNGAIDSATVFSRPLAETINASPNAKNIVVQTLAHTPEMSRSQLHSYVRLLNEVAPEVNSARVSENTLEALLHYKNPTYAEYAGKVFKSPAEYFNLIQGGTSAKMPHVFDDYIASFNDIVKQHGENEGELIANIRKMLGASRDPYTEPMAKTDIARTLRKQVGRTSVWKYDPVAKKIHMVEDMVLNPKIRTVQDIVDLSGRSPWLKFLEAQAAVKYKPAAAGYGRLVRRLSILQSLRSMKGRIGMAAGALGLGGLATYNLARNIKDRK